MIQIEDVSKTFGAGNHAIYALDRLVLDVQDNQFVSLIGPSGCGKTTLLKILGGLVRASSGRVVIDGVEIDLPGPDRAVVFQDFALLPWATVLDNVAFGLEMRGVAKADRYQIARDQISIVGLAGFEDRLPRHLSGGMQQRVGLARALAVDPDILLMDEPFGALDAQTRHLLQEDLVHLMQRQPKTVVFVTHDMDEAVYLSDRVVIMTPRPGRVAEILDVPLGKPRNLEVRKTRQFAELTTYVWERLRDGVRSQEGLQG